MPMIFRAAAFWLKRKGFQFTSAGGELLLVWGAMLIVQAMLGDGPNGLRPSGFSLSQVFPRGARDA